MGKEKRKELEEKKKGGEKVKIPSRSQQDTTHYKKKRRFSPSISIKQSRQCGSIKTRLSQLTDSLFVVLVFFFFFFFFFP